MTKAYSYLRFSTPEQAKGNSFHRQTTMARDYAERHGLELDEVLTFQDLGMSAFRGRNAEAGRLADFLQAVRDGLVEQGSYLLVEALDRISRQHARKAFRVLENIVESGITVVTLNDGRAYDEESLDSDPMALMLAMLTFIRGNEESVTKARRLRAAWSHKRSNAGETPITSRGPAWLLYNADKARFEPIPERVAVVRRVFKLAAAGVGQEAIAATLNQDKVPTFGDHGRKAAFWQRSYIAKILASETTVGTMTPHVTSHDGGRKLRKPETDEAGRVKKIEGYFPAAVSPALFAKVQKARTGNAPSARRGALSSLLAGLAKCPTCGAAMTRVVKGNGAHPYLVCTKAKAGAAKHYVAVKQGAVEQALLDHLSELNDVPSKAEHAALDKAVVAHEAGLSALHGQIENVVDSLARATSVALTKRLRGLEEQREAVVEELDALRRQQAAASPLAVALRLNELERIAEARPLNPAAFNSALRRLFTNVTVNHKDGTLDLAWQHGGETRITYAWPGTGGRKRREKCRQP